MAAHRTRNRRLKKCFGHEIDVSIFGPPEVQTNGIRVLNSLKEIVMNEELQLEIVDLGDAKEETKGDIKGPRLEDEGSSFYRQVV
jgi:hypothetical protein